MENERRTDEMLLHQVCDGNASAFDALVSRYHATMIRLARLHVAPALAEEAAQEAWIAILKGCRGFRHQSSFRTWMFRIVTNRAISHGMRESRADRFRAACEETAAEFADDDRFYPDGHPLAGTWMIPPRRWTPEEQLLESEVRAKIEETIAGLPELQRQVVTLRDVEQWSAGEVCDRCEISESNQRVLLHRARAKVRRALEDFLGIEETHLCLPM